MAVSYGLTNPAAFLKQYTPPEVYYYVVRQNYNSTSNYLYCKTTSDISKKSNWHSITLPNGVTSTSLTRQCIGKDKIIIYNGDVSTSNHIAYYLSNVRNGWQTLTLPTLSTGGTCKIAYSPELDLYMFGAGVGRWKSSNGINWTKVNTSDGKNMTWCGDRFICGGRAYSLNGDNWSNYPSSSYTPTDHILGAVKVNNVWKTYGIKHNTSSPYLGYLVSVTNTGSSGFAYDKSASVPELGPYLTIKKLEINPTNLYLASYNTNSSYNTPRRYDLLDKSQTNWSSFHSGYSYEYCLSDGDKLLQIQNASSSTVCIKVFNSSFGVTTYNSPFPVSLSTYSGYYSSTINDNYAFFKVAKSCVNFEA